MGFFDPVTFGKLDVDPFEVRWKGEVVELRPNEREIVLRLLKWRGRAIRWHTLARWLGFEHFDDKVYGTLRCYIARTRKRFRAVDPAFAELESVTNVGWRWR